MVLQWRTNDDYDRGFDDDCCADKDVTRVTVNMIMIMKASLSLSLSVAQEMLSASISQTRILQTCGVPHPNMVSGANPLQGNDQIHTLTISLSHTHTQTHK